LDAPGFDASILSQFRARWIAHSLEEQVLDILLARLTEWGLIGAGAKQRTNSTHVISARCATLIGQESAEQGMVAAGRTCQRQAKTDPLAAVEN
jgi:hypothetical protein